MNIVSLLHRKVHSYIIFAHMDLLFYLRLVLLPLSANSKKKSDIIASPYGICTLCILSLIHAVQNGIALLHEVVVVTIIHIQ